MRKPLLLAVFLLVLAVAVLTTADRYSGYVIFNYQDYTLETSLAVFSASLVAGFAFLYVFMRIMSSLFRLPRWFQKRRANKQQNRARNSLVNGLIEMAEGRFEKAEKILLSQASSSETALLNYLAAARCAQQLDADDRRDDHLRLAHELSPTADIAIGLTQAELQLAHNQTEQALATLNHLRSISPKHAYVLKLLASVFEQTGEWDNLLDILPTLRSLNAVNPSELQTLEIRTWSGLLDNAHARHDKLTNIWERAPKALREHSELLMCYARHLKNNGENKTAEKLLRNHLDRYWNESVLDLYIHLPVSDNPSQLDKVEQWLKARNRNVVLLNLLGKICIGQNLWGKARIYLETSLSIEARAETCHLLAGLLDKHMNEGDKAQQYYKEGLALALLDSKSRAIITDSGYPANTNATDEKPVLKII